MKKDGKKLGKRKERLFLEKKLKVNVAEDRIWKAKKWEADNFYPHIVQLNEVPETIEDDKLIISGSVWDRLSGGFKRDELCCFGSYMSPEEFIG